MQLIHLAALLSLVVLAASSVSTQPRNDNRITQQPRALETIITISPGVLSSSPTPSKTLDGEASAYNTSMCSICRGEKILANIIPNYQPSENIPPSVTCAEWERIVQDSLISSSEECSELRRSFYGLCCDGSIPRYTCESNIRQQLLQNQDSRVPPIQGPLTPLDVTVSVEYHSVVNIDVAAGTAKLIVTITLSWNDERLRWELDKEHCADYVSMWAGSDRDAEVWAPDVDLYNQVEGMQTLPDVMASVSSDGTIHWGRTGGITAFCQFTGLSQIPFDVLGCQLLIGPRARKDPKLIRYNLFNGTGLVYATAPAAYNEYLPVPELAESGKTYGDSILYLNLFFRRSENYYVNNLIIPTIILTYLSMGTYLLDLRVGERLGYGMSLALVVVAQSITTVGMIPVSNERLWLDKFIGWSFYWVIVGLVESVFVGYLYFLREDKDAKLTPEDENSMHSDTGTQDVQALVTNRIDEDNDQKPPADASGSEESEKSKVVDNHFLTAFPLTRQEQSSCDTAANGSDVHHKKARRSTFKQKLQQQRSDRHFREDPADSKEHSNSMAGRKHWQCMYTIPLRKMDRFFFYLTVISYTIYIIAMFVSRPYWGRNVENPWIDESFNPMDVAKR